MPRSMSESQQQQLLTKILFFFFFFLRLLSVYIIIRMHPEKCMWIVSSEPRFSKMIITKLCIAINVERI